MNRISFLKVWVRSNVTYFVSRFKHRSLSIPSSSFIHLNVKISAVLSIGENCSIMAGNEFKGDAIVLKNRVIVGPNCLFMTDNHVFGRNSMGYSPYGVEVKSKKIVINSDVWIGSNVIITPGTVIGSNSVIAAGSVLFGAYPKNSIIQGNPARVVDQLVTGEQQMPITEVRTLRLSIVHLFLNMKLYSELDIYSVDASEAWKKKYIYWANKIINGN